LKKRSIAMLLASMFLLSVTLTGCKGGKPAAPTVSSNIKVEIPGGASKDERIAYEYIQGAVTAFEHGMEYAEEGLQRLADSFYGTAASTLCALRYAADCLLGEESDDSRPADWDTIASMGWGSPAAYFFEGLVLETQGNGTGAEECYRKAEVNPVFADGGKDLKGIANIKGDALRRLRNEAARVEDEIFALYRPEFFSIPRNENNFNPAYLRAQALKCLSGNEPDTAEALAYFHAALAVDPFSGENYAALIALYISLGDGDTAVYYLNEGLFIDPRSEMLNALINKIEEVAEQ